MNETPEKQQTDFTIFARNLDTLKSRVEVLQRRAVKLGVTPVTFAVVGTAEPLEIKNDLGDVVELRQRVVVRVEGDAPKFSGWSLAATLEHTAEGNLIRSVPTQEGTPALDLSPWRNAPCKCDHCKLQRVRVDTHLVRHDSGEFKQVGANCIADFLGHTDPKRLVALAEFWASLGELGKEAGEDSEFCGGRRDTCVYVSSFLAYAARAIRAHGYVSRKASEAAEMSGQYRETTRAEVLFAMFPPRELRDKEKQKVLEARPEQQDDDYAQAAREWVLSTEGDANLSDFAHNLLVIAKSEVIQWRDTGIAAYVVEAYRRHLEGEKERIAQAARPNVHFGAEKVRYKQQAVLFNGCVTSFETQYGTTYVYTFDHVETGARLKWLTSSQLDTQAGAQGVADFTVKGHAEWKGHKQTELSRVKFTPA